MQGGRKNMDVASVTTDNLSIVLTRILEFTHRRHRLLTRNLLDFHQENFVPRDLPLQEFTRCMTVAVAEHLRSSRLLFQDTGRVRFESAGQFDIDPVVDEQAMALLGRDVNQYLTLQMRRLAENKSNSRLAQELLHRVRNRAALKSEKTAN